MYRREFLGRVTLAAPLAIATRNLWADTLSRQEGEQPQTAAFESPLTKDELQFIAALSDGIIPVTETPGASGAGVPEFIGLLFNEWFTRPEQISFRTGLAALDADSRARFAHPFTQCNADERHALLTAWDAQAFAEGPHDAPKPFFRRFKELTIIGYYTSEVGQTQELKAQFGGGQDVPGGPVSQPPPFRL